ncbi:MAG: hypothetical protein M2R46_03036 [Verrucomicrobia subdivision 3 bacterium]|nr:hypothetical protein [Limisphaerales bacterium]
MQAPCAIAGLTDEVISATQQMVWKFGISYYGLWLDLGRMLQHNERWQELNTLARELSESKGLRCLSRWLDFGPGSRLGIIRNQIGRVTPFCRLRIVCRTWPRFVWILLLNC